MVKNLLFVTFIVTVFLLLSACSSQSSDYETIYKEEPANFVQENYPLFDVVGSAVDSSNYSEVYVAEGKKIDDVALELEGAKQPEKISDKNDNKQVLVYDKFFVMLTEDEENSSNTLIELANKEFVKDNYNPSFFQGMLVMSVLNSALNTNDWGSNRRSQCGSNPSQCYGGYSSSGGNYKGYENSPTVRGGTVRGGGPGSGK
ncbi:DUF4247 domain-containing protein [Salipaludibacillus sp. CF4.18]|uniref:DUF4247 domain-containing protein n=1 Tax=Salipaludibacillus sp. CF4.18 TaxID=3373081 RepID=UPI003EE4DC25